MPIIRDNLEAAILLIVFLSVLPMLYEYLKHRREAKAIAAAAAEVTEEVVGEVTGDSRDTTV